MNEYTSTITFPDILVGFDNEGPKVLRPSVDSAGKTHLKVMWETESHDISRAGGYTDAKAISVGSRNAILVARTRARPHVLAIDRSSGKTFWHEEGDALQNRNGGVHSATYVPGDTKEEGLVVVSVPYSYHQTGDNMVSIAMTDKNQKVVLTDLPENHTCYLTHKRDGNGEVILWAAGRTTAQNDSKNAQKGRCILRKYSIHAGVLKLENEFLLVEKPEELSYMSQPGWYEAPHDIGCRDTDTLWITTESRVIEFDMVSEKVKPDNVSNRILLAERESKDPFVNAPTASNLKCLSIQGDFIIYTQTMGNASSTNKVCIIYKSKKYVFTVDTPVYKARWA